VDLRTNLEVLPFLQCDAALWAATIGMATTVPSLWHKIRCVRVRVCICVCVCVCVALLGYVWHSDHRTLIVAQDQVRACTSVYLCVSVCVCIALLDYVWHGDHRTLIVAQGQVRACTSVYLCVCVALLGYVWHGDHRTLIVAQDQVRACTSVYLCVCVWLCWAMFGIATTVPSLWHKIRCVRVQVCICV